MNESGGRIQGRMLGLPLYRTKGIQGGAIAWRRVSGAGRVLAFFIFGMAPHPDRDLLVDQVEPNDITGSGSFVGIASTSFLADPQRRYLLHDLDGRLLACESAFQGASGR